MKTSLSKPELLKYLTLQLNNFFPDNNLISVNYLNDYISKTIERVEFCFSKVNNKYFFDGSSVCFNHLHADQYAMFLYYLSNTIYRNNGDMGVCSKIFLLNKALHGVDAFYEVALPDIFLMIHPISTVLGRGEYGDYFLVYQRCGIGSNHNVYPKIGKFVSLHPGSSVLGNSTINENCCIAAESLILDKNLNSNTLYIGNPKNNFVKPNKLVSNFWRIE